MQRLLFVSSCRRIKKRNSYIESKSSKFGKRTGAISKTTEGFKQQFNTIISELFGQEISQATKINEKAGGQFGHIGCNKPYLEPTEIINLNDNVCPYCGGKYQN